MAVALPWSVVDGYEGWMTAGGAAATDGSRAFFEGEGEGKGEG